jgi:hypothetical protein
MGRGERAHSRIHPAPEAKYPKMIAALNVSVAGQAKKHLGLRSLVAM